jgi:lantibiotic modifying enzyme
VSTWEPLLTGALARRAEGLIEELADPLAFASLPEPSVTGGSSGAALLFAYLAAATDDPRHRSAARRHLRDALTRLPGRGSSLADGVAGIGWAAQHVGDLLDLPPIDPDGRCDTAIGGLLDRSSDRFSSELLYGLAGIAVFALERLPRPDAFAVLERAVALLGTSTCRGPDGSYDLGASHGAGGMLAPLAGAAAYGVDGASELLDRVVTWLLAHRADGSFPSRVRPGVAAEPARTAWCYGAPGIAAGLLAAGRRDDAVAVVGSVARRPAADTGVEDGGLCHGAAGVAHILNRIAQATADDEVRAAAVLWFERLLDLPADRRVPDGDPGFLIGDIGIALALLGATSTVAPTWDRVLAITTVDGPG